jgi:hypothetical protein
MVFIWIILYFVLSHLIAQYIGTKREIGYGMSVFWSIVFSPVIGLIVTMLSKKIVKHEVQNS